MRSSLGFFISFGVVCVGVACSAGKASPGHTVSSGGNGATGGLGLGGTGAGSGASAGTGTGAIGGLAMAGDSSLGGTAGVPIDAGSCATLSIETVEIVPTVELLVDTSGSMFQPQSSFWDPLYHALMDTPNGVVMQLQDKVRFGFTSYNGFVGTCPNLISVPYAINNHDAIDTTYKAVAASWANQKWETPTGEALSKVAADLNAFVPVPAGPKFILLVTDGNPDTCGTPDPQCGADASIKAVQDAYALGIGTFAIGIGDILGTDSGCVGRCGINHLQDVANAGAGLPVMANSTEYGYQPCVGQPTNLKATYAATTTTNAKYYTVSATDTMAADGAALVTAIKSALTQARSCTFAMTSTAPGDAGITGVKITTNAEKGMFTYNGAPLPYNDPNGWTLTTDQTGITLSGTACDAWKTSGGTITGAFPCDVTFTPVPPPPPPR